VRSLEELMGEALTDHSVTTTQVRDRRPLDPEDLRRALRYVLDEPVRAPGFTVHPRSYRRALELLGREEGPLTVVDFMRAAALEMDLQEAS
jgi:hypothetical protein